MTCTRTCQKGKQPCPTPWACSVGCKSNVVEIRRESPRDRAAEAFFAPDMPGQFVGPGPDEVCSGNSLAWIDYLPNQWDRCNWWQKVLVVCGLIVLCGMVAGILTGIPK